MLRTLAIITTLFASSVGADELGSLSKKYESNGDATAIGYDKVGGYSYGEYQIATNVGTMDKFLGFISVNHQDLFIYLIANGGSESARFGGEDFVEAWSEAMSIPKYAKTQHDFIKATHFDPAMVLLEENGYVIEKCMEDMIWSIAVQHGPKGTVRIFKNAGLKKGRVDPVKATAFIYNERMNVNKYFRSSTTAVKKSILRRYNNEKKEAMAQCK